MRAVLNKRVLRERMLALVSKPCDAPLFVFGNQKSGTSAIAGLLAAATDTRLVTDFAGALEPFVGRLIRGETPTASYIARNAWAFSAPMIKEPSLTFVAPALIAHFPSARAIFVMRDPWQNIRSMLDRLDLRGDTERLEPGKRRINRTWRSILSGSDIGLEPGHFVENLARRWLRAMDIAEQLNNRLIVVRYEDFNASKLQTIERLACDLNLPVTADISGMVDHSFQPRSKVKEPAEFFGANLSRIHAICGEKAKALRYAA